MIGIIAAAIAMSGPSLGNTEWIGDSLTDGTGGSQGSGGHRHKAYDTLKGMGYDLTPVGTLQTWPVGSWSIGMHDGHGGWSTLDLIQGKNGQGCVTDWVRQCQPDTIVLTIGRNDPSDWSYSYQRYTQLANIIFAVRPQVVIYWCAVFLPKDQSYWEDYHCIVQNNAIKQVINDQRSQGRKLWYVDTYNKLKGLDYIFADTVHLNDIGYGLWADCLCQAIRKTPSFVKRYGG